MTMSNLVPKLSLMLTMRITLRIEKWNDDENSLQIILWLDRELVAYISCEHYFVLGFKFFVCSCHQLSLCRWRGLCYHWLLVIVMTTWKRLVSLGRKLCLFVCYVEQVGNKQWVAKGVASIQWRREIGHYMANIRRGIQRQRRIGLWVFGFASIVDKVESGTCKN